MKMILCPICLNPLSVRIAKGRKSNKSFIMLKCDKDGRHFRGFITDQKYVSKVLDDHREHGIGYGTGTPGKEKA